MLDEIFGIIIKAVYWLLVPAALLRFYLQWRRISFRNPLGNFVCALTDWLVLPLRRVIKGSWGLDWASLVAALLLEWGLALLLHALTLRFAVFGSSAALTTWLAAGCFGILITALTMMLWLTLIGALLSWVRADNPIGDVIDAVTAPWLRPIRRRLPMVGGFDLSPLALIVALQIALAVLARVQALALLALR